MSRDLFPPLYPSNSKIIDLRNKITPAPASKTKQFFNELQKISGSSPTKMASLNAKRAYESERWFTPRVDSEQADTSAPPRRSMFTPSRLQLLSAQRGREARKPYWRCPMPSKKPSELSNIERILQEGSTPSSSLALADQLMPTPPAAISITPSVRPKQPFLRRREPETGLKMNTFAVDENLLTIEEDGKSQQDEYNKMPQFYTAPKAGNFYRALSPRNEEKSAEKESLFTFSEPIHRGPRRETKEMGTQTDKVEIATATTSPIVSGSSVQKQNEETTATVNMLLVGPTAATYAPPPAVNGNAFQSTEAPQCTTLPSGNGIAPALGGTFSFGSAPPTTGAEKFASAQPPAVNGNAFQSTAVPERTTLPSGNGTAPPLGGGFSFVNTAPAPQPAGTFHFGSAAPPAVNGFQFTEVPSTTLPSGNGTAPTLGGMFSFGNAAVPPAAGTFQFGSAPLPAINGNAFQFTEASESSSGTAATRHGISARKLLYAKRKKR